MKREVYSCDLCGQDFPSSRYLSPTNGLLLLKGEGIYQRVLDREDHLYDLCSSCCQLLSKAEQIGFTYPVEVVISFRLPDRSISENEIRVKLKLPEVPHPAEIIRVANR